MRKELNNLLKIGFALLSVLLFFTLIRIYFYFGNQGIDTDNQNLLKAFIFGFYYDFCFVLLTNSIIIFLFFFPFRIRNTIFWQGIVRFSFVLLNFTSLLFQFLYVKFYNELSGKLIGISENNDFIQHIFNTITHLNFTVANSWDLFLISPFIFIVLWAVFPSINTMFFERSQANKLSRYIFSFLGIIILLLGYYQHTYTPNKWQIRLFSRINRPTATLALNGSYKLLHLYLSDNKSTSINNQKNISNNSFNIKKHYQNTTKTHNHLIIVNINNENSKIKLKEKIASAGFKYSIKNNFYATAKTKQQQLDELLLSMPAFNNKALIETKYAFNKFKSIASILQKHNYKCFYLSNKPIKQAKTNKNYYDFNELIVNNNLDESLSLLTEKINNFQQKYFIFINTDKGFNQILNFISNEYFKHNVFVIINIKTKTDKDFFFGKTLFLLPIKDIKHIFATDTLCDLDIFPSAINYLGFNTTFTAFGNSVLIPHDKELFQYTGKDYILINDSLLFRYNGISTKWLINYHKDPDEFEDLQDYYPVQKMRMENKIRAIINTYKINLRKNIP